MESKSLQELIDLDFPEPKINEHTRQVMTNLNRNYLINDVRLVTGRFYTDSEYETMRQRVLSTPLP